MTQFFLAVPFADNLYLIEVDRVLRPGGYWILSGPPINWKNHHKGWERTEESLKEEQDTIEDAARRLCWKKVKEEGNLAIWQKPWNHIECVKYHKKNTQVLPHVCSKAEDPDHAWYLTQMLTVLHFPYLFQKFAGKSFDLRASDVFFHIGSCFHHGKIINSNWMSSEFAFLKVPIHPGSCNF